MAIDGPAIACRTMENESNSPGPPQHTRRELIKRSAAAGVAVWAAPAILSVSRAAAASPIVTPTCCTCFNDATALRVTASGLLADIAIDVAGSLPCIGPVNAGVLAADVLCADTGCADGECFARASVDNVSIGGTGILPAVLSTTEIASEAIAPCNCDDPSGSTTIASLTVLGTNITIPANIPANSVVGPVVLNLLVATVTATITLNEQTCLGSGQFRVRAIHISITGTGALASLAADIVISESIAQAQGCTCA